MLDDYSIMVPREIDNAEWRWVFICSTVLLVVITAPFVWAYWWGEPDASFTGVLVNPVAGASYQAQMQQGMQGSWLYQLPYTSEPHQGVFLHTFYLALGHLAGAVSLPPILIFHAARLVGAAMMFLSIYRFVADWTSSVEQRRLNWLLVTLGAGLGWLALGFGHRTPDVLLLPEAFPLQAAYANAHLPWAIGSALLFAHILVVKCLSDEELYPGGDIETIGLIAATLLLANVSPFVLVPIGAGFAALLGWLAWRRRTFPRREFQWGAVILIFGLPFALYSSWAVSAENPIISGWLNQALDPTPPVWDVLIAFGPLLVLAAFGLATLRRTFQSGDVFLLGWLIGGIVLMYAPFSFQRRFATGLIMPLTVYAGRGLWRVILPQLAARWRGLAAALTFAVFLPTTVLAIVLPVQLAAYMAESGGGRYYVSADEEQAFDWLAQHATGAIVLAAPETAVLLPVYGVRVIYEQPRAVEAHTHDERVLAFYSGADCSVVAEQPVDYVLVGPREREIAGGETCAVAGPAVYQTPGDGEVIIYATRAATTN